MAVKFGTDGWRSHIGFEYNAVNLYRLSRATARYFASVGKGSRALVGYDNRFMSEEFAQVVASALAKEGIEVSVFEKPVPTPLLAWNVVRGGYGFGIMLTASHNPHYYHGFKVIPWHGSPAEPEITRGIEEIFSNIPEEIPDFPYERMHLIPVSQDYSEAVSKWGRDLNGLDVFYSAMHGTGAGFTDRILESLGARVRSIRVSRDPYFGGIIPEPKPQYLSDLSQLVVASSAIGLANDGDADRFGAIDESGNFVQNNLVLLAVAWYLLKEGYRGGIGRTVATTHMLDRLAKEFDVPTIETPVGFKWLGRAMREGKIFFGGEESGGLGVADHVPEKDGVLADVLFASAVSKFGGTVSELVNYLMEKYGPSFYERRDYRITLEIKAKISEVVSTQTPPRELAGYKDAVWLDGMKLVYPDGAWVLIRLSGTEPLVRVYVEAPSPEKKEELHGIVRGWIFG